MSCFKQQCQEKSTVNGTSYGNSNSYYYYFFPLYLFIYKFFFEPLFSSFFGLLVYMAVNELLAKLLAMLCYAVSVRRILFCVSCVLFSIVINAVSRLHMYYTMRRREVISRESEFNKIIHLNESCKIIRRYTYFPFQLQKII